MNLEITISIVCIYQYLENNSIGLQKLTLVGHQTLCLIEAPVLSSSSSRKYIISETDYEKITEAYDKLII